MLEMQAWQWMVVGVVAVLSAGYMSLAIARMFSRRAEGRAEARQATPFESMLADASSPEGSKAFDGFSYRVGARFAGKVRVVVGAGRVVISGPRVPRGVYVLWIWAQGLLTALVPAALAATLVGLDWRWLLAAAGLFVLAMLVSTLGAAVWPALGEGPFMATGLFDAVELSASDVRDVAVGEGWARGGLEVVLFPVKAQIDKMAEGHAVSFFAPDETGREVRYAIHVTTREGAGELAALLRAAGR